MLIVGLVSLANEIGVVSVVFIVGVVYVGYEVVLVSAVSAIKIIIIIIIIIIKTLLTCQMPNVHGVQTNCVTYRIYSINHPERLLNFWTLRVGAYSRRALIRGWAFIKFSPFSASVVCLFCNKAINGNIKTQNFEENSNILVDRRP